MGWLAALIPFIWQMISGKSGENAQTATGTTGGTTTTVNETPAKVAFDPLYYALSPTLMKAIGGNYLNMAGAGMPGGKAAGDVGLGNISDIIAMISESWPDIMKGYAAPAGPTTPAGTTPATQPVPGGPGTECDSTEQCAQGLNCKKKNPGEKGYCVQG